MKRKMRCRVNSKTWLITSVIVLGISYTALALGEWAQQAKLLPSDGGAGKDFGISVAIWGETAVIGSPSYDTGSGSAYVFTKLYTDWVQQAKLTASDAQSGDYFGESVSISGDYIIVGAPHPFGSTADAGSAYIFKREGANWVQQAKLTASDGKTGDG